MQRTPFALPVLLAALAAGCGKTEQAATPATSPPPTATLAPPTTVAAAPPAATAPASAPQETPAAAEPASAGLALAQRSGCLACHAVDRKVVGPAWRDVSLRYKGDAGARGRLIKKVHDGGKGNWTEVTGGITMPPYGPRVPSADIESLVDFVLGLAQ